MTNEASKLAKDLEGILHQHAQQAPKNRPRTEAEPDNLHLKLSLPIPMRAQQPVLQRRQFYTGDA
jgi:hypothetical protein